MADVEHPTKINWILTCARLIFLVERKDPEKAKEYRRKLDKSYRANMKWIETVIKGKPGWILEDKTVGIRIPVRPDHMLEDMKPYESAVDKLIIDKHKEFSLEIISWLNETD